MTSPKTKSGPHKYRVYGANICYDCKKACGDCEWSEVDLDTGKIQYQPVPGWTAELVLLAKDKNGKEKMTFHITACPKFDPLPGTRKQSKPKRQESARNNAKKPVVAISQSGETTWYPSICAAAAATGASRDCIRSACNKKYRKSGGLRWKYANPKVQIKQVQIQTSEV